MENLTSAVEDSSFRFQLGLAIILVLMGWLYISSIIQKQEEIEEEEPADPILAERDLLGEDLMPPPSPPLQQHASLGGCPMELQIPTNPEETGGLEIELFSSELLEKGGDMVSATPPETSSPNVKKVKVQTRTSHAKSVGGTDFELPNAKTRLFHTKSVGGDEVEQMKASINAMTRTSNAKSIGGTDAEGVLPKAHTRLSHAKSVGGCEVEDMKMEIPNSEELPDVSN